MIREIKDTVPYMVSGDRKQQLVAELAQVKLRRRELSRMLKSYYAGELDALPYPADWLENQVTHMYGYERMLSLRVKYDGVNIDKLMEG